ncbi:hypothetical protein ASE14_11315 [Agromyces sp. Root81]|uniref:hypothetical protein n=1 Tax=Agromyces sp. Root81 TaxID=1736601 RepID=UPI0006FEE88B|nr:hypothetical protein [Agromyces sp. Root81]KRC61450.1 hypothetical protein ASE14_11315 [Agromyces sp. Root81]
MAFRTQSLAAIAAGALVLILSGCGAGALDPSASDSVTSAPTPVETTAGSTDAPVDPAAAPASCDTVLTEAENQRLAAEGHALEDDPFLLGPVMERMAAEGALVCVWSKPNSDVSVWYARLDVGDQGETWLAELQADGWLEDTHQGDGSYQAPADYDANYQPSVMLDSGVLHFASYNALLREVAELQ